MSKTRMVSFLYLPLGVAISLERIYLIQITVKCKINMNMVFVLALCASTKLPIFLSIR